VGREFVGKDSVALVLGDNIFCGDGLSGLFQKALAENDGATIFAYAVKDPERYGVPSFDQNGRLVALEEKPQHPGSNLAITGLYMYDNEVLELAADLKPSARGLLEITDLNQEYLKRGRLRLIKFGPEVAWLDTGTPEALLETTQYIASIERGQGLKVGCIEEVAYRMGYVGASQVMKLADNYTGEYHTYLQAVAVDRTKSALD
jgi:glucose-1-phosphate thymidylyltransferase